VSPQGEAPVGQGAKPIGAVGQSASG